MITRTLITLAVLASIVAITPPAISQHHQVDPAEISASIPLVSDFHEVIYDLWHKGYPEKDYTLIKSKAEPVRTFAEELPKVKLPGILRDKKEKWIRAVNEYLKVSELFLLEIKKDDPQKLLDVTEELHAKYEGLIRAIRPVLKEVDAYHKVLYVVYHKQLPDMLLDEIEKSSIELGLKCNDLLKASLPKRLEKKSDAFTKARTALCDATSGLIEVAKKKNADAVKKSVEDVHTKYQLLEKLFD